MDSTPDDGNSDENPILTPRSLCPTSEADAGNISQLGRA